MCGIRIIKLLLVSSINKPVGKVRKSIGLLLTWLSRTAHHLVKVIVYQIPGDKECRPQDSTTYYSLSVVNLGFWFHLGIVTIFRITDSVNMYLRSFSLSSEFTEEYHLSEVQYRNMVKVSRKST